MRLCWTRPALTHIAEISAYIREDNPAAARRVVDRIRQDAKHLSMHPLFGRKGRIEERGSSSCPAFHISLFIVPRTKLLKYSPSSIRPATGRNLCL